MHSTKLTSSGRGAAIGVLLLAFVTSSVLQSPAADQPQPGPEHKKLAVWVGEWNYEGAAMATPFTQPGKFTGKLTTRAVLNGFFIETHWKDKNEQGYVAEGIELGGYDPANKNYTYRGFENDGSITSGTQTVSGTKWSGASERSDGKGKTYPMRWSATFSADGKTVNSKTEYSADGGKTWSTCWELTATKTGD